MLLLGGELLDKPVAGYSPFVMNSQDEIRQTISDRQSAKPGLLTTGGRTSERIFT
jgi:redox-sensitive bicupin YhaK (pirin superfamily)